MSTDILKRLAADLSRLFPGRPEADDTPPDPHQLPDEDVERVVRIIRSDMPHMPYGLEEELRAWESTRTIHDAKRVANALRHAYGRDGLAREIEDILPE